MEQIKGPLQHAVGSSRRVHTQRDVEELLAGCEWGIDSLELHFSTPQPVQEEEPQSPAGVSSSQGAQQEEDKLPSPKDATPHDLVDKQPPMQGTVPVEGRVVTVTLMRDDSNFWVSWGLVVGHLGGRPDQLLGSCATGSIAADSAGARACIGMVLHSVNGIQVHTNKQVAEMVSTPSY